MPTTRSSATAGPSRIPRYAGAHTPSSSTRAIRKPNLQNGLALHLETPTLASAKRSSRGRSVSFQPPDRDEDEYGAEPLRRTPSRTARTRHQSTHSATSLQHILLTPPVQVHKKPAIRKSLTGANVLGMTINDRADILSDVAGDCLVTLVSAGLNEERPRSRRSGPEDEIKKRWDALYALRQSYIFPPYSPPFPLLTDILQSLHSQVRATLNPASLARAAHLSNIATFVYTIIRPDEAGDLLALLDIEEVDTERHTRANGKGKGRDYQQAEELHRRVRRRNSILLMAWKRFWLVAVSREKRTSESALRLWLDFATQIVLVFRVTAISQNMFTDPSLPGFPRTLLQDLFSPSAVGRYGQWEITEDWDSQDQREDKVNMEQRWRLMAKRRSDEIHDLSPEELRRRYPYDIFVQEMMAYIQHEALASPNNALLTPGRQRLLIGPAYTQTYLQSEESDSVSDEGLADDETQLAEWSDDPGSAEEQPSDLEEGDKQDDGSIDMDLAAMIAAELEAEMILRNKAELPQRESRSSEVRLSTSSNDGQAGNRLMSADAQLGPNGEHVSSSEEEEWAVREYVAPTAGSKRDKASPMAPRIPTKFNWAAKQDDADQLEWESQSMIDEDQSEELLRQGGGVRTNLIGRDFAQRQEPPLLGQPAALDRHSAPVQSRHDTGSPPPIRAQRFRQTSGEPRRALLEAEHRSISPAISEGHETQDFEPLSPPLNEDDFSSILPDVDQLMDIGVNDVQSGVSVASAPPGEATDDGEFADILPGESQLAGLYGGDESPKEDDEFMDVLPSGSQLDDALQVPPQSHDSMDEPHMDVGMYDHDVDEHQIIEVDSPVNPTVQQAYISSRPRKSMEAHEFAIPDHDEDMDDRDLLVRLASSPRNTTPIREVSVKPEPFSPANPNSFIRRIVIPLNPRGRGSTVTPMRDEDDPFLCDEEGRPLEPDPLYALPHDHQNRKSRIHGRTTQSSSTYCRLSGRRRWTKEEELLLYRTVQKVPMEEEYPLRVVWTLYGEFGKFGQELKWYNPQHMKDKMRTTVERRMNGGRPVLGRARAWAKNGTKERESYEKELAEVQEAIKERDEEDLAAEEEEQHSESEGAGENEHEEGDVNDVGDEEEDVNENEDVVTDRDSDNAHTRDVRSGRRGNDIKKGPKQSIKQPKYRRKGQMSANSVHGYRSESQEQDVRIQTQNRSTRPGHVAGPVQRARKQVSTFPIEDIEEESEVESSDSDSSDSGDFPEAPSFSFSGAADIATRTGAVQGRVRQFATRGGKPNHHRQSSVRSVLCKETSDANGNGPSPPDRARTRAKKRHSSVSLESGDDDQISDNAHPTKKRRSNRQSSLPSEPVVDLPATSMQARSPSPLPKQARRGRPRKSLPERTGNIAKAALLPGKASTEVPKETTSKGSKPVPIKRGRGRPRKNPQPDPSSHRTPATQESHILVPATTQGSNSTAGRNGTQSSQMNSISNVDLHEGDRGEGTGDDDSDDADLDELNSQHDDGEISPTIDTNGNDTRELELAGGAVPESETQVTNPASRVADSFEGPPEDAERDEDEDGSVYVDVDFVPIGAGDIKRPADETHGDKEPDNDINENGNEHEDKHLERHDDGSDDDDSDDDDEKGMTVEQRKRQIALRVLSSAQ